MRGMGVAITVYASLAALFLLLGHSEMTMVRLVLIGIFVIGILSGVLLICIQRRAMHLTYIFLSLVVSLGVIEFFFRVKFIIENGGMDRADGYGSPLAFLFGWIVDQAATSFAAICLLLGLLFQAKNSSAGGGTQDSVEQRTGLPDDPWGLE